MDFQNTTISKLPDITKIDFTPISFSYFKVVLFNFLMFIVLISIILGVNFYFNIVDVQQNYFRFIVIGVSILLLLSLLYCFFEIKRRRYALRDYDINYKEGLWFYTLTSIPYSRIQHIEVQETIISKMLGLASVEIFTAGDDSSDLTIKGLTKQKALQIRELILQKTQSF